MPPTIDSRVERDMAAASFDAAGAGSGEPKVYFRPALYWQVVSSWHVADAGLEFRMNFTTGQNEGRFPSEIDLDSGKTAALAKLRDAQLRVVPAKDARPDAEALLLKLCRAATWGDAEQLQYIIRSCYVTKHLATQALAEAAQRGFVDACTVLLQAGASPTDMISPKVLKTPLHSAAGAGQEEVLKAMVSFFKTREESLVKNSSGKSCFDVLEERDMRSVARRLRACVANKFPVPGEAQNIIENLWLGPVGAAQEPAMLRSNRIGAIVSVMSEPPQIDSSQFDLYHCALRDDGNDSMFEKFETCNEFIASAVGRDVGVLIHCSSGISRSATVMIAFLMAHKKWNLLTAMTRVKAQRPWILPNQQFFDDLVRYEAKLLKLEAGRAGAVSSMTSTDYDVFSLSAMLSKPLEECRAALEHHNNDVQLAAASLY